MTNERSPGLEAVENIDSKTEACLSSLLELAEREGVKDSEAVLLMASLIKKETLDGEEVDGNLLFKHLIAFAEDHVGEKSAKRIAEAVDSFFALSESSR